MFDITSSKLLLLGVVALLVIGPKDLPALLRTIGKYMGIIKRQAAEFRAQFDEAMRESELDQIKKDVENIRTQAESTLRDVEQSVETEIGGVRRELDATVQGIGVSHNPDAHDANGLPFPGEDASHPQIAAPATGAASGNGAGAAAIAAAAAAAPPPGPRSSAAGTSPVKADA